MVVEAIALIMLVASAFSETSAADADDAYFLEEPQDLELSSTSPVEFRCRINQEVSSCRWWRQDAGFYPSEKNGVVFTGNRSEGDCSIRILSPQVGKHTTLWQCLVNTKRSQRLNSREAHLIVKNFPRPRDFDHLAQYSMMYVHSSGQLAEVHLEMKTPYETRVRWFVNGEPTAHFYESHVDLIDPLKNQVKSMAHVDFSNTSYSLRIIHVCVEYLTRYMSDKEFETFEIFLINDEFNNSIFKENKEFKFPMEVVRPKIEIYLNDKRVTEDRWVTVTVDYPSLNELYFRCEDAAAFPTSLLNWKVESGDSEITSGFEEFNITRQTMTETEEISLMALLRHADSWVKVSCHARSIFLPHFSESFEVVTVDLRYVVPRCVERIAARNRATSVLAGRQMPNVIAAAATLIIPLLFTLRASCASIALSHST